MNTSGNRRVQMTKNMIKDALFELLEKKALQKISVRELCEKADINRATFYKYYADVFDLMDEVNRDFMHEANDAIGEGGDNFRDRMINMMRFAEKKKEVCKLILANSSNNDFLKEIIEQPLIARSITESFQDERLKKNPYLTEFIVFGCYHVMLDWIKKDCPDSPTDMADHIIEFTAAFM